MTIYEIELSSMVTISITKSYPVEANSKEEAIALAKAMFDDDINSEYTLADYDEVSVGYTGILKEGI